MAASAAIIGVLGALHLLITFRGNRLQPFDEALLTLMRQSTPRLTRQTTMWRAWVGFNASHSLGAMLFGLIYAYLAVRQPLVLFTSGFLLGVGLLTLVSYTVLARRYWFRVPLRATVLSLTLYVAGLFAVLASA